MTYFRYDTPLAPGQTIELRGDEAQHLLKSRRIRQGERFALQDPQGQRFAVTLVRAERHVAHARVEAALPVPPPPARQVILLQAAVKDKAAEWIIEKGTELGLAALCFFPTDHSTVAHADLDTERQLTRWVRIAWEACKQCDRQFPPRIGVAAGLEAALVAWPTGPDAAGWVLDPAGADPAGALGHANLNDRRPGAAPARHLLVGPEGGLTPAEVTLAQQAGYAAVRLGPTILRAETAALAAITLAVLGGNTGAA